MTAWLDEFIAGADGRVFPHPVQLAAGPRFWLSLVSRWVEVAGRRSNARVGNFVRGKAPTSPAQTRKLIITSCGLGSSIPHQWKRGVELESRSSGSPDRWSLTHHRTEGKRWIPVCVFEARTNWSN
jgi:hypothetical protein